MPEADSVTRRFFTAVVGLGFLSTLGGFVGTALAYLWPVQSAGASSEFLSTARGRVAGAELGENEAVVGRSLRGKVLVVRKNGALRGLEATCTHLGCTPKWLRTENKYKCPCHGSGFRPTGVNFEGPAPRPLERARIVLADDGQILVDKARKFQFELGQWADPESFLRV